MKALHRTGVFLLCAALLNLSLLTGCATLGRSADAGAAPLTPEQQAYVERLRATPPEDLTIEEIAYLEMVEQQRRTRIAKQQADDVRTIRRLTVIGFVASLIGLVGMGTVVANTDSDGGSSGSDRSSPPGF